MVLSKLRQSPFAHVDHQSLELPVSGPAKQFISSIITTLRQIPVLPR